MWNCEVTNNFELWLHKILLLVENKNGNFVMFPIKWVCNVSTNEKLWCCSWKKIVSLQVVKNDIKQVFVFCNITKVENCNITDKITLVISQERTIVISQNWFNFDFTNINVYVIAKYLYWDFSSQQDVIFQSRLVEILQDVKLHICCVYYITKT